jgi:hypothetical protein
MPAIGLNPFERSFDDIALALKGLEEADAVVHEKTCD